MVNGLTPILFLIKHILAGDDEMLGVPPFYGAILPPIATRLLISGVTRDASGAIIGGCTVKLYRSSDDVVVETVVSDALTGFYVFSPVGDTTQYYTVQYKTGTPDVFGSSANNLVGI